MSAILSQCFRAQTQPVASVSSKRMFSASITRNAEAAAIKKLGVIGAGQMVCAYP